MLALPEDGAALSRWQTAAPYWVLAFVAFWPLPAVAEAILALAALHAMASWWGLKLRKHPSPLGKPAKRMVLALFLAYWLPELFSAFDAVDRGRAWGEVAMDLRYLPFMVLVAVSATHARTRRTVWKGLAIIVAVWTVDALVQAISGISPVFSLLDGIKRLRSPAGLCPAAEAAVADRLSGVLGPCNLKLGPMLASFAPFALYAASRRFGTWGWLIAAAALGVVIVLAGARAAWITYALVVLCTGWPQLGWKKMLAVAFAGVAVLTGLTVVSPQVQARVERSLMAFSEETGGLDDALSGRERIWNAALCMVCEHPVNGVGVRGFRFAYPACDPAPDSTAAWGAEPAFHAHQIVLELLSETGTVGLLIWLGAAGFAVRAWRRASPSAQRNARPAALALAVTVFPLNTHLAFYSTFWGGVVVLLAAVYAGALFAQEKRRIL
jgi:O-antigen ligase